MKPLERAARAICLANDLEPDQPVMVQGFQQSVSRNLRSPNAGPYLWERFIPQARAVLQAIREPSEAMTETGGEVIAGIANLGNVDGPAPVSEFFDDANGAWRAMIDAALGGE